jgi:hypothetical protein
MQTWNTKVRKYWGKSKAYPQFVNTLWRIRSMVDFGVIGIEKDLAEKIDPVVSKFSGIKGIAGRAPKKHESKIQLQKTDQDTFQLTLDARSAFLVRQVLTNLRKKHNELQYFHYSTLVVSTWAAFETYSATLFEQLYSDHPDLLKSSEQIAIKDTVEHRGNILNYLIERQLESIGHMNLSALLEYWKKRLGIELPSTTVKHLELCYFLRNVIAHKTGLIRPTQKLKLSNELRIVAGEIRVSRTFLVKMITRIEGTVMFLERRAARKFFSDRQHA